MSAEQNADNPRPTHLADSDLKKDSQNNKLGCHKVDEKVKIHPILKERRLEKLDASSSRC